MLQPNHRGIYEYLWSEHKYLALGVSIRAFQTTASRLGNVRQCQTMLKKLLKHALAERPEHLSALLSAYMLVKPYLSRSERECLIKTMLGNEDTAAEMIYSAALKNQESTLYGCRLFFPEGRGIYKFWDVQHHPGIWMCFGPFQLHLTPSEFSYLAARRADAKDFSDAFLKLSSGTKRSDYNSWPEKIRFLLETCNMVALAGDKAWLHPRAHFDFSRIEAAKPDFSAGEAAALTMEKIWDESEQSGDLVGEVPEFDLFKTTFEDLASNEILNFSLLTEAYDLVTSICSSSELQSESGVAVETADEEIYSEQGEHGDDETED
ncbi:MAG: hypothetical protein ACOYXC_01590 [Candidatus Rifleibacteriota bacterium]